MEPLLDQRYICICQNQSFLRLGSKFMNDQRQERLVPVRLMFYSKLQAKPEQSWVESIGRCLVV